jgi:23S rRNA (cytosine1962-C5)-methyltransferase
VSIRIAENRPTASKAWRRRQFSLFNEPFIRRHGILTISHPFDFLETARPNLIKVVLKPRKALPFYGRHPWVLDSAIERVEGVPADGEAVDLYSDKDKFIARGAFNGRSRIRVRLYTWNPAEQIEDVILGRLEAAVRWRDQIGYNDPEGAAWLVFSEGDGLSGLIVDRYADYLAVQVTALAVAVRLEPLIAALVELARPKGIVLRTERSINRAEGLDLRDGLCWGKLPEGDLIINENGLRFHVDLSEGQKTGFYLDQRENRAAATRYMRGRRVLDVFCYSGGFGLAAARSGAIDVLGVDSSEKAVSLARANAQLNGLGNVRIQSGDCFKTLESLLESGERFGAVVLDPPKFARDRRSVDEALRAYHWLNRLGLGLLEPGGFLVTCSCSGHVTREDFLGMLFGVAQQTRRDIQVLEQRGAAPDHPVAVTCQESEYLKCFICRAT